MSRPLRTQIEGGWYHVFSRGLERRSIFRSNAERRHFLELLGEVHERYRFRIHAYVLMDNHYHCIIETPDANLSRGMQWLHTSYSTWFNAKHERVGPLFQGRYRAIPVEDSSWAYELSFYLHLNPLRVKGLGLDKRGRIEQSMGLRPPSPEVVSERLKRLRAYPWSSYRPYANYTTAPAWLTIETLLARSHSVVEQRSKGYRVEAKNRLSYGQAPGKTEQLRDSVAIGSATFVNAVREGAAALSLKGVVNKRALRRRIDVDQIQKAVTVVTGTGLDAQGEGRGVVSRPLYLWAMRRYSGLTLSEIGESCGGMAFSAVSVSIRRFEKRAETDPKTKAILRSLRDVLNVEP